MAPPIADPTHEHIASIEHKGHRYSVSCRIAFDGVEHVGRLWFTDEASEDPGIPDRAALPGHTREEVLELARRLTPHDLGLRHRRALAEKRKFIKLRGVTEDILSK